MTVELDRTDMRTGTGRDAEVLPPKPRVAEIRAAAGDALPVMTWNGGPIMPAPELVSLFWGDFEQAQIDAMRAYLTGYAGYLRSTGAPAGQRCVVWQYGVGGGSVGASHVETATPRTATEADVKALITSLQRNGSLPGFSANRLFLVFTHGITFSGYGTDWCGYHGSWGSGQYFAIVPYPTVGGCGSSTPDASWQSVTSHEINEAATDPGVGSGWTAGDEEGGDTCAWLEATLSFGTVQRFEDNLQSACSVWTPRGLMDWSFAGNTLGRAPGEPNFGQLWDGRPFWIGNFSRPDRSEVLFYFPGDGNWWLGTHDGTELRWSPAGNTLGHGQGEPNFGQVWDGRPFWIGDFTGDGRDDVLFYHSGGGQDGNWWCGSDGGSGLSWQLATHTTNFGFDIADGRPFWIGRFSRPDRSQVLFYFPGDGNWWLASS